SCPSRRTRRWRSRRRRATSPWEAAPPAPYRASLPASPWALLLRPHVRRTRTRARASARLTRRDVASRHLLSELLRGHAAAYAITRDGATGSRYASTTRCVTAAAEANAIAHASRVQRTGLAPVPVGERFASARSTLSRRETVVLLMLLQGVRPTLAR